MAILLETFSKTRFDLVDYRYLLNSNGERADSMAVKVRIAAGDYGDLWINASRWAEDFIGELNKQARSSWTRTDGEYCFIEDGEKRHFEYDLGRGKDTDPNNPLNGVLPPIGYFINGELVAWVMRGKYTRSEPTGRYYNQTFSMHRLEAMTHPSINNDSKRLLSDVGANPKKTAKTIHKHMYDLNVPLTMLSHDLIITRDERDRIMRRIDAEGDFNASTMTKERLEKIVAPCGVVKWSGYIGKGELLNVRIEHHIVTLVEQQPSYDPHDPPYKARRFTSCPGGECSNVNKIETNGNVTGPQARSMMSQLQLALGYRYIRNLESFKVEKTKTYYSKAGPNNFPPGTEDEDKFVFKAEFTGLTEDELFDIIPRIRRTDSWRECWAMVVGERLLKSAGSE